MTTLYPNQPSSAPIRCDRQGRSSKTLKPVVKHDGRVFVARYEGRAERFFGATEREAKRNLQAGAQ
jgi:hypothetical protein